MSGSYNEEFWDAIDRLVSEGNIVIDRPKGSPHPKFPHVQFLSENRKNPEPLLVRDFRAFITEPRRRRPSCGPCPYAQNEQYRSP